MRSYHEENPHSEDTQEYVLINEENPHSEDTQECFLIIEEIHTQLGTAIATPFLR